MWVPSKSALYDVVSQFEKGGVVENDDWGVRGKKRTGAAPKNRNIRAFKRVCPPPQEHHLHSLKTKGEWMGHIKLHVALIHLEDMDIENNCVLMVKDKARFDRLIRKHLKESDICVFLGWEYSYDDLWGKPVRMYFCQNTFPPPATAEDGGKGPTFERLKSYIRMESLRCGSPVICNGNGQKNEKRFCCNKCSHSTKSTSTTKWCRFNFRVRWDNVGYYIYLSESLSGRFCFGSPNHTCNPVSANKTTRNRKATAQYSCSFCGGKMATYQECCIHQIKCPKRAQQVSKDQRNIPEKDDEVKCADGNELIEAAQASPNFGCIPPTDDDDLDDDC